jgi:hypothetical protein
MALFRWRFPLPDPIYSTPRVPNSRPQVSRGGACLRSRCARCATGEIHRVNGWRKKASDYANTRASMQSADARSSADIPGSLKSSGGGCCEVGPGGVFVVSGVGFQAAVQDADEPVGQLSQGALVADIPGPTVGSSSWPRVIRASRRRPTVGVRRPVAGCVRTGQGRLSWCRRLG